MPSMEKRWSNSNILGILVLTYSFRRWIFQINAEFTCWATFSAPNVFGCLIALSFLLRYGKMSFEMHRSRQQTIDKIEHARRM